MSSSCVLHSSGNLVYWLMTQSQWPIAVAHKSYVTSPANSFLISARYSQMNRQPIDWNSDGRQFGSRGFGRLALQTWTCWTWLDLCMRPLVERLPTNMEGSVDLSDSLRRVPTARFATNRNEYIALQLQAVHTFFPQMASKAVHSCFFNQYNLSRLIDSSTSWVRVWERMRGPQPRLTMRIKDSTRLTGQSRKEDHGRLKGPWAGARVTRKVRNHEDKRLDCWSVSEYNLTASTLWKGKAPAMLGGAAMRLYMKWKPIKCRSTHVKQSFETFANNKWWQITFATSLERSGKRHCPYAVLVL